MHHINWKVIMGLGAAAALAIIAVSVVSYQRRPHSDISRANVYALPELRDRVNDVQGITLTVAEDKPVVTLEKTDEGWAVKEKGDYPADTGKLRELLLKLADASLLEPKTANKQRYPELGVEDVTAKDAKGVKVSLEGLGKPVQLIIGQFSAKAGGTFVRRPEDQHSWLAKGNLTTERDPLKWLDESLVDISADRIAEIILTKPGGKTVRLFKEPADEGNFKLADVPAGREPAEQAGLSGPASALAGLSLLDVASRKSTQAPGDDLVLMAGYRTVDGLKLDIWAWKQDDKHYARLTVALEQAQAEARIQSDQAKAKADFEAKQKSDTKAVPPLSVSDPGKDREQRLAQLASEAGTLSQRFDERVFVIPADQYDKMDKSVEDFLKPLEQGQAAPKKADAKKAAKGKR
jgi:hypothetical protein